MFSAYAQQGLGNLVASVFLLSLISLSGACGSSGENCVGHACPDSPVTLPEGGEVRLEYVHRGNRPPEVWASAWFASAQDPDARVFARDPARWGVYGGDDMCRNVSQFDFMPDAEPTSRTYVDVGDDVRLTGSQGNVLMLPRVENGQDNSTNVVHDLVYLTDLSPGEVQRDETYEILAADGTDLEDLFMPAPFGVTFPNMMNPIAIPLERGIPILWESPEENARDYVYAFVVFADAIGPLYRCIGPNVGQMEIPAEVIADLPANGQVLVGVFSHRVIDVGGRRVDKIGVSCYLQSFYKDWGVSVGLP